MMTEQQSFEGPRCPVRQKFITSRDKWVDEQLKAREERLRNKWLDRKAEESAYMDKYELGIPTS